MTGKSKWSHADLNRRPPACHAGALPAELWPQIETFVIEIYIKTSFITSVICIVLQNLRLLKSKP